MNALLNKFRMRLRAGLYALLAVGVFCLNPLIQAEASPDAMPPPLSSEEGDNLCKKVPGKKAKLACRGTTFLVGWLGGEYVLDRIFPDEPTVEVPVDPRPPDQEVEVSEQ